MAAAAEVKKQIAASKKSVKLLGPMPDTWSIFDAKELVEAIRTTVLNYGYLIGLGGDILSEVPSNTLQLIFTPGSPVQLAEAIAPQMKGMFIYVNAPNEEKLMKWLDKVWGTSNSIVEDDPVASYGSKKAMNNGGEMPKFVGYDKNRNYVYVNKVSKVAGKASIYPQYTLGKRIIQINILPTKEG